MHCSRWFLQHVVKCLHVLLLLGTWGLVACWFWECHLCSVPRCTMEACWVLSDGFQSRSMSMSLTHRLQSSFEGDKSFWNHSSEAGYTGVEFYNGHNKYFECKARRKSRGQKLTLCLLVSGCTLTGQDLSRWNYSSAPCPLHPRQLWQAAFLLMNSYDPKYWLVTAEKCVFSNWCYRKARANNSTCYTLSIWRG